MPFIGNTPAAVPLTSADIADSIITSAKIVDATIANADIANSTINLTTKVTGTLPVANGGTGLAALGSANQVLAVNSGGTALAYTAVSSDFVLLASTDASSSASVSFDGYFSSTYKNYKIIVSNYVPASAQALQMRYRRSNADISTSNYIWLCAGTRISDASAVVADNGAEYNVTYINCTPTQSTASSWNGGVEITLYDPLGTNNFKTVTLNYTNVYTNPTIYSYTGSGGGILRDSASALSGVTFLAASGNITRANFKLYGIK